MGDRLDERHVSDAFHSYLMSCLAHARAENLLDTDLLSSAEADLMITGPALCLYFAALRSTTSPPSVPLPRSSAHPDPPVALSPANCPPPFLPFLRVWAHTVPTIQRLPPAHQHDLARTICARPPLQPHPPPALARVAAQLRAVAIAISQRRTFQDRYAADLQAALDVAGGGRTARFVPPPEYDECQPPRTPKPPPAPRSRSPPSFAAAAPAIQLIRETLYASLADVLAAHRPLRRLLARDPPRAYFASVALAILAVARTRTRTGTEDGAPVVIDGVLGAPLTLAQCPPALQPFMRELGALARAARAAEEADTARALALLAADARAPLPTPRMERVRRLLARGVGGTSRSADEDDDDDDDDVDDDEDEDEDEEVGRSGRRSVEGRALALANRINALALGMTRLRAFRDRQSEVFAILASVVS